MAKTFIYYDKKDISSNLIGYFRGIIGKTFLSYIKDEGSNPSSSTKIKENKI
tara:strand:+ start:668 stop:823 length:156 start_codon:yes stop_codon:yes gene_type:complete